MGALACQPKLGQQVAGPPASEGYGGQPSPSVSWEPPACLPKPPEGGEGWR
jgi:hypothetical protein